MTTIYISISNKKINKIPNRRIHGGTTIRDNSFFNVEFFLDFASYITENMFNLKKKKNYNQFQNNKYTSIDRPMK